MKKAFVGALFAAPAFLAVAAPLQIPTNVPIVEVAQQTNTYTFTPVNETNSTIKRVVPISDALVTGQSVSDVEPKVSTTRRLPIGTGAEVTAKVTIPKKNVAKALVATAKGVGKLALPGVAALALDALLDFGISNIKVDGDNITGEKVSDTVWPSNGTQYRTELGGFWGYGPTPQAACDSLGAYGQALFAAGQNVFQSYRFNGRCVITAKGPGGTSDWERDIGSVAACPAGYYFTASGSCSAVAPKDPADQAMIERMISESDGWPSSASLALQGMLGEPSIRPALFTPDLDQNLTLEGPNSATGKTTKTTQPVQLLPGTNTVAPPGTPASQTQPGTQTTTSTTTHPITYSGNSVSYTTNNTTNNSITNNVTNVTTNETKTEEIEDDKNEQMAVDTPLGDVPKLYEKKYPDGLIGVWDAKKAQFEQTSFFRMIGELTPKIGQAGSCPSWSIDLSWTPGGSMGVHQLQPPCMIWPILKVIVIISALFLARALIFGG